MLNVGSRRNQICIVSASQVTLFIDIGPADPIRNLEHVRLVVHYEQKLACNKRVYKNCKSYSHSALFPPELSFIILFYLKHYKPYQQNLLCRYS